MKLDIFIGITAAALIHAGAAFGTLLLPVGTDATKAAPEEEIPTIALAPLPQLEPEPPTPEEIIENLENKEPPPVDIAPPTQADIPAPVINSPFVQKLQPPPPPDLGATTSAITIPKGNFNTGAVGIQNIFDVNALDQKPVARFTPKPTYPYEMRRARINGEVLVGFIVDSDGNVRDPYIIRSTNPAFDNESLRTVLRWKFRPGRKGGKNVHTRNVQLPFTYSLTSGNQ